MPLLHVYAALEHEQFPAPEKVRVLHIDALIFYKDEVKSARWQHKG